MQQLDTTRLEPFIDGLLGAQIAAYQVPGAAVSVVQDGRIVLSKGYGMAATGRPVDAERTVFRVGSVAKVLTWMSLLQLAETGDLALNEDITPQVGRLGRDLGLQGPVTPAQLMTHSAGLEERMGGLFATSAASLLPLPDYLRRYPARQTRAPGKLAVYSNYSATLAGYLVERVTGERFEDYVSRRIFAPLRMARSTFAQPPPEELRGDLATGHGTRLEPLAFEWLRAVPSGALSTSAEDMARLMLAIYGGGRLDGARVLQESSVKQMLERQFANDPRLPGLTYGFDEYYVNGQRLLWHPGDTLAFSAALVLLPAHRIGMFVVYNRLADSQPRADFIKTFMDRFFPAAPLRPLPPASGAAERGRRYAGSYLPLRANHTGPEKLFKLFNPVTVEARSDGALRIQGLWVVKDGLWSEREPGLYRHSVGDEWVVFRADDDELVLLEGNYPQGAYARLPWYGNPRLHLVLWLTAGLAFGASIGSGILSLVRRSPAVGRQPGSWAVRLVRSMSIVQLGVMVGLLVVLANLRSLAPQLDGMLRAFGAPALVGAVLAAAALIAVAGQWRHGHGPVLTRVFNSGTAILGALFALSLMYWRVLPLGFH